MIIDTHAHIVADDPNRYPPAPLGGKLDTGALDDPVTAERLLRLMDQNGIHRAIVVQRAHIYGYDNSYVVESARRYPDRLSAVICVDAEDAQAPAQIRHWIGERGAVGLRLVAPGATSPTVATPGIGTAWFAGARALRTWEAAAELGASVCIHFFRWNRVEGLAALPRIAAQFPATKIVLDHVSNIAAEQGAPDYGIDDALRTICSYRNVYQKITTINLGRLAAQGMPLAPAVEHIVQACGANRVMWGSDIAQSKGIYAQMLAWARAALAGVPAREEVLVSSAADVYGFGDIEAKSRPAIHHQ
jgi:L-fuconolactonase